MATSSSLGDSSFLQLLHKNYLECTLCYETYKKPKYLSCHHTFCQGCLENFRKHKPGDIVCPTCREVTKVPKSDGISGLRNNFLIRSLTEDVSLFNNKQVKCDNCHEDKMAAMVCVDCATYFCAGCFESHQRVKTIRDAHNTFQVEMLQNVTNLQQFQKNRFAACPNHNEPMKLYCKCEQIQLCHTCSFSSNHQGHEMCPIQEQLEELLAEITSKLEKNQVNALQTIAENDKLEEVKREVENTKSKSLADLEKERCVAIRNVHDRYNTMKNKIEAGREENISICDAKIAKNIALKKSCEGKIAEKEALTMIPISSCIEAAESFLMSIREADQSTVHKVDAEKEGKIMYFKANNQEFVVSSGCVKSKSVNTKKRTAVPIALGNKPFPHKKRVKRKPADIVDEPVDKSLPHYKHGRNVQVGDQVICGPDWESFPLSCSGTVIDIKINCVKVKWPWGTSSCSMTELIYRLQLAPK